MKKGLKKYTVPYEGTYFDGGKIFGQRIVFAQSKADAQNKVQQSFKNEDEPIKYVGTAHKWEFGEKSESEIYAYL